MWAEDHAWEALELLGTIAIGLGALWIGLDAPTPVVSPEGKVSTPGPDFVSWPWGTLYAGIGAQVLGKVMTWSGKDRLSKLRRDLAELEKERDDLEKRVDQAEGDYYGQLVKELSVFANDQLKLGDDGRVSVYGHDARLSAFTMLGRYSKNPSLAAPGRRIYPDHEGCIGQALQYGSAFTNEIPDYDANADEYVAHLRDNWKIPPETAAGFKMKPRAVAAYAIEDHTETPRRRFAVLVVETLGPEGLNRDALEKHMYPMEENDVAKFLVRLRPFQPSPAVAKEAGF